MKTTTHHTVHQGQHGTTKPCSNVLAFRGDNGTKRLLDPKTQPLGGDVELAASAPSPFQALCGKYGWQAPNHTTPDNSSTLCIAHVQLVALTQQIQDLLALADISPARETILAACREQFQQWADDAWLLDQAYKLWLEEQQSHLS